MQENVTLSTIFTWLAALKIKWQSIINVTAVPRKTDQTLAVFVTDVTKTAITPVIIIQITTSLVIKKEEIPLYMLRK